MGRGVLLIGFVCLLTILWSSCGSGSSTSPPPSQLPPPSPLPTPTLLRTMYRVLVNGTDRMTTAGPDERSRSKGRCITFRISPPTGALP